MDKVWQMSKFIILEEYVWFERFSASKEKAIPILMHFLYGYNLLQGWEEAVETMVLQDHKVLRISSRR